MYKVNLKARNQQFDYPCAAECNATKSSPRSVYSDPNRMSAGWLWDV